MYKVVISPDLQKKSCMVFQKMFSIKGKTFVEKFISLSNQAKAEVGHRDPL